MIKTIWNILVVILLCTSCIGPTAVSWTKFQVGDLVYICNEDPKDNLPLCITEHPSKIIKILSDPEHLITVYEVQIYAENYKGWKPIIGDFLVKYIHKW